MSHLVPLSPSARASRYSRDLNLADLNNAHTIGVLMIAPGSRVLEIGTADGSVARGLTARGCSVLGIEIDPIAAAAAERYCEEVICADVETLDLAAAYAGRRFDIVLMLDVLEHLQHPGDLLRRLSAVLEPHGTVVASIPNVAHSSVRLQLLHGNFPRTETGLLDRTHLQFFDRAGVEALFESGALHIRDIVRVTRRVDQTELQVDVHGEPPEVLRAATGDAESDTYQFVVVAAPGRAPASPGTMLAGRLQERVHGIETEWRAAEKYVRSLEAVLAERERQLADAETTFDAQRLTIAESERRLQLLETERVGRDEMVRRLPGLEATVSALRAELARLSHLVDERQALLDAAADAAEQAERDADQLRQALARTADDAAAERKQLQRRLSRVESDATEERARLHGDLATADRQRTAALETVTRLEALVREQERQLADLAAARAADAMRHREQTATHKRNEAFQRRDIEVKDAYIGTLRQRQRETEEALAIDRARIGALESEAVNLRETEAAFQRVATTPRYWLADVSNRALKRAPRVHRVLRAAFVRVVRLKRDA